MSLTPAKIATKLGANPQNVGTVWPLVLAALDEFGIRSDLVEVAAAATIMVETGRFWPIRELHADPKRQPDLWKTQERYWPSGFYGRGLVQTTWHDNYQALGDAIGIDLIANPDKLLEPGTAARALAFYFKNHQNGAVVARANAQDWPGVRRGVNGGTNGLDLFLRYVNALLEGF